MPDSHLNAYIRFQLARTEQHPTIMPYNQELWAERVDSQTAPVEPSLALLNALHTRRVIFLHSLQASPRPFA